MKNVLVWGKCEASILCGMVLVNDHSGKYRFLGSYDKSESNRNKMINPTELIGLEKIDLVLTIKNIVESVREMCDAQGLCDEIRLIPDFFEEYLRHHPKAVGNGSQFGRWILSAKKFLNSNVDNFWEIGSNYSQDSNFARCCFGISDEKIYCFEANPQIAKAASALYPYFNIENCAVSDREGDIELYLVPENDQNSGLSTVLGYSYTKDWECEKVKCIRLESYLKCHKEIKSIDFLKIDVEGLNYEVLESLGNYISIVKCIQIEAEFINLHEKYCFKDIALFLYSKGFEMVDFSALDRQNDSLWIRKELLCTVPIY